MTIGHNIKKYRKQAGLTQEALAEKLLLSPSAVSQWETDRVMPDISHLPILCKIFGVTSDQLLGIDSITMESIIDGIIEKSNELCAKGMYKESCNYLRNALSEYPTSYELMSVLAHSINGCENTLAGRAEQIALFAKIIEECDNENLINTSVGALCGLYAREGRVDDAKGILKHVPDPVYSHKECLLAALSGTMEWVDEACLQINEHFHAMINLMCQVGKWVEYAMSDEDILKVWEKVEKMVKAFYEDGDYQFSHTYLLEKHFWSALRYAKLISEEESLNSLENMMDLMEKLENERYRERSKDREEFHHTSVLSLKVTSEQEPFWTGLYEPYFYYEKMKDLKFDSIRNDERFISVFCRLGRLIDNENY